MSYDPIADGTLVDDQASHALDQTAGLNTAIQNALSRGSELDLSNAHQIGFQPGAVVIPQAENLHILGQNGRPGPAYLQNGTKLVQLRDDLTIAPWTRFELDWTKIARFAMEDVAVKLLGTYAANGGVIPNHSALMRVSGSHELRNVSIEGGASSLGYGGGAPFYANTTGFDHSHMEDVYIDGGGFALDYLPGSNAAGDQRFFATDISGGLAAIGLSPTASSGLVGTDLQGIGLYAAGPAILRVPRFPGDTGAGGQFQANVLGSFSAEFEQDAVFFDQQWASGPGLAGAYGDNHYLQGFYQAPRTSNGYAMDASVTAWDGASAYTLNVSGSNKPGFWLFPGLDVIDALGNKASIVSIDGAWPWASATVHLSKTLGSQTGSLHVTLPKLAAIVAGAPVGDTIDGKLMRTGTGYALYASNSLAHDNFIADGLRAYAMAQLAPLYAGKTGPGLVAGRGTVVILSGHLPDGVAGQKGDLLASQGNGTFALYDGTAAPSGTLIRATVATTPGGSVDVQARGWGGKNPIAPAQVINKSGADIPANAPFKGDKDHPGGVMQATPGDPAILGRVGSTALVNGAVGSPADLRVPLS